MKESRLPSELFQYIRRLCTGRDRCSLSLFYISTGAISVTTPKIIIFYYIYIYATSLKFPSFFLKVFKVFFSTTIQPMSHPKRDNISCFLLNNSFLCWGYAILLSFLCCIFSYSISQSLFLCFYVEANYIFLSRKTFLKIFLQKFLDYDTPTLLITSFQVFFITFHYVVQ